ncbi:MAG: potassium transporter [Deltaproteobacteria bacterium]|nr:potassium transporter [Deltaproteobacteria bacterium]
MHDAHAFLQALAVVLCVAAVTTVLFQRLHQPVVLGYVIAGLIVGPHVPIPLIADVGIVKTLSEVGVILLMFALGLEFSLRKLLSVGPTAGTTGLLQCSFLLWLGYALGRSFGWTTLESFFTGAIISISSTTIIAKAFDEQAVQGRLRELVVGVLIVEDLIAILLMATLTTLATGSLSASELAITAGKLGAFLVALVGIGLFIVPRAMRAVLRMGRDETTLIASIGICFAISLFAQECGYSVALGAFLAGSLVAESGETHEVERLVLPVRDVFAAIFFVSVGMLIDPALLVEYWAPIAILTLAVVLGKILSVSLGAFLTGNGVRTSVQAGMSLAQIGEFSFIIAGLGLSLNATRDFLYPIAVAVSALTTLSTPWLIRASDPLATFVDRKLPKSLQTFVSLYGSWWDRLRAAPAETKSISRVRRLVRLLLTDAIVIGAIAIGTTIALPRVVPSIASALGSSASLVRGALIVAAVAACLPFGVGLLRVSRALATALADRAFPAGAPGSLDFAVAVRTALVITLQVLVLLVLLLPLGAITQPLLSGWESGALIAALLLVLVVVLWRSTTNLDAHVRAGAQMVVEALSRQSAAGSNDDEHALDDVKALLPGLEPEGVRIPAGSLAAGKTLAELHLRGVTGATVIAIGRAGQGVAAPSAREVVREGDVLALAGTREAIAAARALLCSVS